MKSNEIEKTGRTQEVEMKTQEKARRVDKIASLKRPKKNTLSKERARGPQQEQVAQSSYGRHQGDNNDFEHRSSHGTGQGIEQLPLTGPDGQDRSPACFATRTVPYFEYTGSKAN